MKKKKLGAKKIFANIAAYGVFTYTDYKECGAAALIEYSSVFLSIGWLAVIVLNIMKIGIANAAAAIVLLIVVNIMLRILAGAVNDFLIKRRIGENAEFAKYFAAVYPEHAELCKDLNEEYAVNPDMIPDVDFHPNRAKKQKAVNVIKYIGLGILVLVCAGLFVLAEWLDRYVSNS